MSTESTSTPEWEVKLYFKASKLFKVEAEDRASAHKAAYDTFMDMAETDILKESSIADFFIETEIGGEDGSDMLHH
tara:strand:+ start:623 stop:850 length:228 start_codon:yes stop_codon:yes gene_type:complete